MITKEILLEQFNACYDENGWFVALKNALRNLSATDANWKPAGVEHSVRETVNHLIFWNERWLRRFRGQAVKSAPQIAETFLNENEPDLSEAVWEAAVDRLYEVFDAWKRILETITEAKLAEKVSESYDAPWSAPLAQMNIHNAYHIGQIVFARKLQGSWKDGQGVS